MEGLNVELLSPLGAQVIGLDLRVRPSAMTIDALERIAALHGFVVFPNQTLPDCALVATSTFFGSGMLASLHTVHNDAVHDDIFRVSNDERHGIVGVGPQWHSDGATERRVFSHILFHAQRMPSGRGGGTAFADLAGAFAALPRRQQEDWSRLATVNAFSGAVHPLVITHPVTRRRSLFVHLGMVGAVIRWGPASANCGLRSSHYARLEAMEPGAGPFRDCGHEVLDESEARALLSSVDALLSQPEHSISWPYRVNGPTADLLLVDNLAAAHRATQEAHDTSGGLRILHRATVQGIWEVDPAAESQLPPFAYIWGDNPCGGNGLWEGSDHVGVGFRWNRSLRMQN